MKLALRALRPASTQQSNHSTPELSLGAGRLSLQLNNVAIASGRSGE